MSTLFQKPALSPLEKTVAEEAVYLVRSLLPGLLIQTSMADATLKGDVKQRSTQMNAHKARGFSAGEPDMKTINPTLKPPYVGGGLYLEWKRAGTGIVSVYQMEWMKALRHLHQNVVVVDSVPGFFQAIVDHYGLAQTLSFKKPLIDPLSKLPLVPHLANRQERTYAPSYQLFLKYTSVFHILGAPQPKKKRVYKKKPKPAAAAPRPQPRPQPPAQPPASGSGAGPSSAPAPAAGQPANKKQRTGEKKKAVPGATSTVISLSDGDSDEE
jgi:hypothetical protein